jgi:hypothetical protein
LARNEGKEGTWIFTNLGRHKRLSKPDTRYCQPIPRSVNWYEVLQNLNELKTGPGNLGPVSNKRSVVRTRGVPGKKNIIIIGDSHVKGCVDEIIHNLERTFDVTGYLKPWTGLENITNIARKEIDELTKKDMIVFWGGTSNIAKNES